MTGGKIEGLFDKFNGLRCLIIGDVMVDSYIWGVVNRMSPEAPVPVFEVEKRENRLGGAANVALNIQSLGAVPILCGVVGSDAKGEVFRSLLDDLQLTTEGIVSDGTRSTTSKTRIISTPDHMMRVDEEVVTAVSHQVAENLLAFVKSQILQGIDVVIFEDYDKGVLSEELIQKVIAIAKQDGIPTCVDPKKNNFNSYQGATLFKPNFKEFTEGLDTKIEKDDFDQVVTLGKKFVEDENITQLLITLSEHGMIILDRVEKHHLLALKRNILDVSGAGDTVISTAALALAAGCDAETVAILANLAGGIVCEKVGVVPISRQVLMREYNTLY